MVRDRNSGCERCKIDLVAVLIELAQHLENLKDTRNIRLSERFSLGFF